MKAKKLLAMLMALVMMASITVTSTFAEESADADAKPIVDWNYLLETPDSYWYSELVKDTPLSSADGHYDPLGAVKVYYEGPVIKWQGLQYGGIKPINYTSLSQFDGVCFYMNVSEEHKFRAPVVRFVINEEETEGTETKGETFGIELEIIEKGKDAFYYIKWEEFVSDVDKDKTLSKEAVANASLVQFALYNGTWNENEEFLPISDFVISDIYGYKTNGAESVDDYTFYIPHDASVKNLPEYFADRAVDEDLAKKINDAYLAADALKDKAASVSTEADVNVIQAFLDLYDSASSGTKEFLAKQYGITKDPNAESDSWYRLDAVRQNFVDDLLWRASGGANTTPDNNTPTTPVTVAKAPAKVKKVKAKAKGKKKVVVTWKKAKNAKKYNVRYSYKKNMKKAKTTTVKNLKATLKKLKSGKKVYIQVRGVNGKVKGKWSAKASVKVK